MYIFMYLQSCMTILSEAEATSTKNCAVCVQVQNPDEILRCRGGVLVGCLLNMHCLTLYTGTEIEVRMLKRNHEKSRPCVADVLCYCLLECFFLLSTNVF